VHGFGKGAAAAMSQALEMRERFACEVLLYSWPTGSGSGLFAAIAGFKAAQAAAVQSAPALGTALGNFCFEAEANADVAAVVLARSLGALALEKVGIDQLGNLKTQALRRLVLSAPACSKSSHDRWLEKVKCPVVITVNREDRTLRLADALEVGTNLLGCQDVEPKSHAWTYLDCTDVPGVGSARAHDYLYRNAEPNLAALNRQLLNGQVIDFPRHQVPGMIAHSNGQRYPATP
jgi:hypothetical protein